MLASASSLLELHLTINLIWMGSLHFWFGEWYLITLALLDFLVGLLS